MSKLSISLLSRNGLNIEDPNDSVRIQYILYERRIIIS